MMSSTFHPDFDTNFSGSGPDSDKLSTEIFAFAENFTLSLNATQNTTESDRTYIKPFYQYDIYLAAIWLFRHSWKFIAPPGLVGNFIVIIVTMKMKPFNSSSLFMISLAIVDLLAICVRIPFKDVQLTSTVTCQAMWYLYNVLPIFSNYTLLFWTLERVIAVQFPLRVTEWCTIKRTAIVITAAGIFSFGMGVPWPVSIVVQHSSVGTGCTLRHDMVEFIYDVWYKVDSSIFIFIPMIIIFFSNLFIIAGLQQSTKRHQQMTSSEEARKKREKEQRNTTITLLSVSLAFLVLHTPLAVYNCFSLARAEVTDQEELATWDFINVFGLTMMELQNSVNFYLYFLTGRRYRQITFNILVPCRKKAGAKPKGTESTTVTGVSVTTKTE